MHNGPHPVLLAHQIAQLSTRHVMMSNHSASNSSEHVALNSITFPTRLRQQNGIDNSPDHPMSTQSMHKMARVIPEQVLGPILRRNFVRSRIVQVNDAHGKVKWMSPRKSTNVASTHRVAGDRRPTVNNTFRHPRGLHFWIQNFLAILHGTTPALRSKKLIDAAKLEAQDVLDLFIAFFVRAAEVFTNTMATPCQQRSHSHMPTDRR
jgi:hypothetical protein